MVPCSKYFFLSIPCSSIQLVLKSMNKTFFSSLFSYVLRENSHFFQFLPFYIPVISFHLFAFNLKLNLHNRLEYILANVSYQFVFDNGVTRLGGVVKDALRVWYCYFRSCSRSRPDRSPRQSLNMTKYVLLTLNESNYT